MRGAGPAGEELAKACEKEKNWRFKYQSHFMKMVKLSAKSPEIALGVATAGANYMHETFEFVEPTTKEVSKFSDYMAASKSRPTFQSYTVKGI
jgi:hypothetical protein